MDKKIFYLRRCRAAAEEAGRAFDMNPRVILAQGALESGWGTSCLATEHNNYFGIMGYGASNAWWHGERVELDGRRDGPLFPALHIAPDVFLRFRPPDPYRLPPCLEL